MAVPARATYHDDGHHLADDNKPANLNTDDAGIAEGEVTGDQVGSGEVSALLKTTGTHDYRHVYAASFSLNELTFTFDQGGTRTWNPETLRYELSEGGGGTWNDQGQDLNVSNYSDLPVKISATVSQASLPEEGSVTVTATKKGGDETEISLESAYNSTDPERSAPTSGTFEVKVTDSPAYEHLKPTKIATITLTLSKAP